MRRRSILIIFFIVISLVQAMDKDFYEINRSPLPLFETIREGSPTQPTLSRYSSIENILPCSYPNCSFCGVDTRLLLHNVENHAVKSNDGQYQCQYPQCRYRSTAKKDPKEAFKRHLIRQHIGKGTAPQAMAQKGN